MSAHHHTSVWARGRMRVSEEKARKVPNVSGDWRWVVVNMETGNAFAYAQTKTVAIRTRTAMESGMLASREYYAALGKMQDRMGLARVAR